MSQSLFANRRIRIKPSICMMVKRQLKGPGRILVQKNTDVSPHDVIGHYKQTLGFTVINAASELGVNPSEVPKLLKKSVGQTVFKGELVASKKGLFKNSQILSPTDGIFQSLNEKTGEITYKLIPKDMPLSAGVFGIVENVDPQKGEVIIKSMMTEVYGVYGSGNEKEGFINVIAGPTDLVDKEHVSIKNKGQIIVAGSLIMEATIKKALGCGVSGIVCGGLNMDDYLAMALSLNPQKRVGTEIGISIIASEGFGLLPMGDDFYEILKRYAGRFAIIQGNLGRILLPSDDPNSILSCRKIALPLKEALGVKPELSIEELKKGSKVRLIAAPFMGAQGEVLAIDGSPTKLESGISTYLITIGTRFKKIKIPYSNVEIIG